MGIIDEIKQNFKQGNNLIKLIYINIGVFLLANISLLLISFSNRDLAEQIQNPWFSFPSSLNVILLKPWTIITYMFYHVDIWHIVFNLIFFYWFGQIFLQYLDNKKFWPIFEVAEGLDIPVYIHARLPSNQMVKAFLGYPGLALAFWGYGAETSLHAIRLICSGVFEKYPTLHLQGSTTANFVESYL